MQQNEIHPNHHSEDVIEENAEERLPHEDFYAAVDTEFRSVKEPFVEASVKEARANGKYATMAVVPGVYLRGCLDISSFALCLVAMVVQLGLIDYYYITVMEDSTWWAWAVGDAIVLFIFVGLVFLAIRHNQQSMEETCSLDGKVKYAWIAWLLYSLLLVGKVAACFRLFHEKLVPNSMENHDKFFDDHLLKLGLCLSALIFIFLLEAHHYTPLSSPRQLYMTYLMTAIVFDLLDTVAFLDLLFQGFEYKWDLPFWLDITILSLACFNFVLPAFALLKLRFNRHQRVLLVSEKVWAFFYVLLVNGPFLGFRIYLYVLLEVQNKGKEYDASIFGLKNVAMIYIALRELWTRLHYWRQKRGCLGSRGELTGHGEVDHEDAN